MGKPIRIAILANGAQARREFGGVGSAGSRMGDMLTKAAKAGVAGVAMLGAAAVKLGMDSVSAASDAEQSLGATSTVFGKHADTVVRESERAATAVGLSANEYRELANVTGASLAGAGVPMKQVTSLTQSLTKRASDLAATFGGTTKEAIEAVGSLMRGEADPIERYGISIKQSDVNARMAAKGLGKLEGSAKKQAEMQTRVELLMRKSAKSSGAFARETDTLAHKQQVANAKFTDAKVKLGNVLMPMVAKASDLFADELVPALEDATDWLSQNSDEILSTGKAIAGQLLPPLETLGSLAMTVGGFLADLPGPVKTLGIEAGLAALVLPRLMSATSSAGGAFTQASARARQLAADLSNTETRTAAVQGVMGKLKQAAGAAAGVGGMVLLAEGMKRSDSAAGALLTTAGGFVTGFAVGGPVGGAIGGLTGLLGGLSQSFKDADRSSDPLIASNTELAGSFDKVTAAVTEATRAAVTSDLQKKGLLKEGRVLGLSNKQLVDAVLGEVGARKQLDKAIESNRNKGGALASDQEIRQSDAAINLSVGIGHAGGEYKKYTASAREAILANRGWIGSLKGLPREVKVIAKNEGFKGTLAEVKALARQHKLTPKQIKILARAEGIDLSKRQLSNITKLAQQAGKQKPKVKVEADVKKPLTELEKARQKALSLNKTTGKAKLSADTSGADKAIKGVKRTAQDYSKTKIKGPNFAGPTQTSVNAAKTVATTGGNGIGSNVVAGATSGVYNNSGAFSGAVRSMVRSGIAAGRDEAKIASPSKITTKDGRWIAKGYEGGITGGKKGVAKAMRSLVSSALRESGNGTAAIMDEVSSLLDRMEKKAMSRVTGKAAKGAMAKRLKAQRKDLLKATRDEAAALAKNAKQREALASGNYLPYLSKTSQLYKGMVAAGVKNLDEAKANLTNAEQAFRDYRTSVADSVRQSASLMKLGEDTGFGSVTQMIEKRKALVAQAGEWERVIAGLTTAKLNKTDLDELIAQGPEQALGTARTILAGGQGAVNELNKLQTSLNATANRMGQSTAVTMRQAGVDSAKGLVDGLTKQSQEVDAAAKRLAKVLVKAFKKELGIKSPSRKMIAEGKNTVDGVVVGMEPKRVEKASAALARAALRGYGSPELAAPTLTANTYGVGVNGRGGVIRIELTAQELDQITRGRMYSADIDAYARSGGRKGA